MLKANVPLHMVGIRDRATFLELLDIGSVGLECQRYSNLHFAQVPFHRDHSERWPKHLKSERVTILDTLNKARGSLRKAQEREDAGSINAAQSRVALNEGRLARNTAEAEKHWHSAKAEADRISAAFKLWKWLLRDRLSPINTEAARYYAQQCFERSTAKHEQSRQTVRAGEQSRKPQPHDNLLRLDKIHVKGTPSPGFHATMQKAVWDPPKTQLEREANALLSTYRELDPAEEERLAAKSNRMRAALRRWEIAFGLPYDRDTGDLRYSRQGTSSVVVKTKRPAGQPRRPDATPPRRRVFIPPIPEPPPEPTWMRESQTQGSQEPHDQHVTDWRAWRAWCRWKFFETVRSRTVEAPRAVYSDHEDLGGGLHYSGFSRGRGTRRNITTERAPSELAKSNAWNASLPNELRTEPSVRIGAKKTDE